PIGEVEYPPPLITCWIETNIEQYDQVYTVSKVCDDEDIIEKNLPKESNTNSSVNLI
ncbi:hypothetical protein S83_007319, partial [Arachis hypogaea]